MAMMSMQNDHAPYEAEQIVSKRGNRLVYHKNKLERILKPAEDSPVAVVSVCGDQRKGKSFFLNLFLRHLINQKKPWNLAARNQILQNAFTSRGGMNRTTEGIWMLNKPIWLRNGDQRIAFFLMDTQGMFDTQTSKKECAQIFALSTVMSSYLMFNLMQQIQANDINQLELWTGTAKWAERISSGTLFQNLLFLLRDFPDPDLGYGLLGGKNYMSRVFSESRENDKEINKSIRSLKHIFGDVSACTLPRPQETVATRGSRSNQYIHMNDIGNFFLEHCEHLFRHITQHVRPLNITGIPLKGRNLLKMVGDCCTILLSDEMPQLDSLGNIFAKFQLQEIVERVLANYEAELQMRMSSAECVDEFHEIGFGLELMAVNNFRQAKKIGSRNAAREHERILEEGIRKRLEANAKLFVLQLEIREKEKSLEIAKVEMHRMKKDLAQKVTRQEALRKACEKRMEMMHREGNNSVFENASYEQGGSRDHRWEVHKNYEELLQQLEELRKNHEETRKRLRRKREKRSSCFIS